MFGRFTECVYFCSGLYYNGRLAYKEGWETRVLIVLHVFGFFTFQPFCIYLRIFSDSCYLQSGIYTSM